LRKDELVYLYLYLRLMGYVASQLKMPISCQWDLRAWSSLKTSSLQHYKSYRLHERWSRGEAFGDGDGDGEQKEKEGLCQMQSHPVISMVISITMVISYPAGKLHTIASALGLLAWLILIKKSYGFNHNKYNTLNTMQ